MSSYHPIQLRTARQATVFRPSPEQHAPAFARKRCYHVNSGGNRDCHTLVLTALPVLEPILCEQHK